MALLDTEDLLARLRIDLSDPELPGSDDDPDNPDSDSLWSNADLLDAIDQAQEEYATETHAFFDSSTFTPAVTAGDPLVALDYRIIDIRNGRTVTGGLKLDKKTVADMEREIGSTWELTTGQPKYMVVDHTVGYLRLWPIPATSDALRLYVYRLPLSSIECAYDSLEVRDNRHRRGLLLGAMALAYNNYDSESRDDNRAAEYRGKWEDFLVKAARDISKVNKVPRTVRTMELI